MRKKGFQYSCKIQPVFPSVQHSLWKLKWLNTVFIKRSFWISNPFHAFPHEKNNPSVKRIFRNKASFLFVTLTAVDFHFDLSLLAGLLFKSLWNIPLTEVTLLFMVALGFFVVIEMLCLRVPIVYRIELRSIICIITIIEQHYSIEFIKLTGIIYKLPNWLSICL